MDLPDLLFMIELEVIVVISAICGFLILKNRNLTQALRTIKEKSKKLSNELNKLKKASNVGRERKQNAVKPKRETYLDYVETQIAHTLAHHSQLGASQDISLDIAAGTPLPYRAAALRHAILVAEKEAFTVLERKDGEPDWSSLRNRYDQIFNYYDTFECQNDTAVDDEDASTELDTLRERTKELEKYKVLYHDLGECWRLNKRDADDKHGKILELIAQRDDNDSEISALEEYRLSYKDIHRAFEMDIDDKKIASSTSGVHDDAANELRQLSAVNADQLKTNGALKQQLAHVESHQELDNVSKLQQELTTQLRYVKESETCVQLLEEELTQAQKDVDELKSLLDQLPKIKSELLSLREKCNESDARYDQALTENQKLKEVIKKHAKP